GQKRVSGDPYVSHPIAVACILIELGMDSSCVAASLLHDVVEDTDISLEYVAKEFSESIAYLVDGVTKLGKVPLSSKEEEQAENVRKMILAMSEDVRVIIIKLADRLHNMRTMEFMHPQKQRDKSRETMEIYAPIAHRLGIRAIKEELEDLSLKYLDPIAYDEIINALAEKKNDKNEFIDMIKERIGEHLEQEGIHDAAIEGRVKSIYGIYRKVYAAGRTFDEVYDIFAVRVIVSSVIECYNVLGVMHEMFRPIPNRFKDYISTPKPNMYQSLHTTVLGKEGVAFEIQIRTWDMHYTSEYGIAAHWKYKAGISGKNKLEERLSWIRQMIEIQQESDDAQDLVQTIKSDLSNEEVFVFTPKGDVKSLPIGSTVIDFAYAIHSAVGNKMIGAKVDGKMVSLDYTVKMGQIIEIVTSNSLNHGPSRDWLKIVRTSEARNKIRAWFKKERREENILEGKMELETEFKRNNIRLNDEQLEEFVEAIAKRQHCDGVEDFYAAIGYGGIILSKIIPRIKDDYVKIYKDQIEKNAQTTVAPAKAHPSSGVIIEGIDGCLVKFSQCCNPLPGDDIIGFITRGHGVSIHKRDCVNVTSAMKDKTQLKRWVQASWADQTKTTFRSTIEVLATARDMLVVDIGVALSNQKVPIYEINARELKNGNASAIMTVGTAGKDQLDKIISILEKVPGVISVSRTGK
ncbi:MAG: bifunctional (p)ppGpp synthetase/guanosine-3',5'-bis(diphosphate) 3'-pyrophosphohydrolase, partial [Oscillospiraceae bacterium]|nr:bifunctional (p)ppGpp synthetase/guanosine-3',5'-bis(diphosphate) 3'-pyrophosphohydrolase [Oscillospiraceae bacterium]